MRQFKTIFQFEFKNYYSNKLFIGITIFLVVMSAVGIFLPRILSSPPDTEIVDVMDRPVLLIASPSPEVAQMALSSFVTAFPEYNIRSTADSSDQITALIRSGEAEAGFLIHSLTSYTYYVNNTSIYDYDDNTEIASAVLQDMFRASAMIDSGMSSEHAERILAVQVDHETSNLGEQQISHFLYAYIMVFALYLVIMLYGQMVATNVGTEKSSRAMELLITSVKPTSMMFGKVVASCFAGLMQLTVVFGLSYVFIQLNKSYWMNHGLTALIFDIPFSLLIYMLIFFVLGFLLYAFLYGAIGSTVSKVEDIGPLITPLTLLFVLGFVMVITSVSSGTVDTSTMLILSYIPFTSPLAMFARIAMSTVPFYQIFISIVILMASVWGVGVLSARIYRIGVLLYGTRPKISTIFKLMTHSQ